VHLRTDHVTGRRSAALAAIFSKFLQRAGEEDARSGYPSGMDLAEWTIFAIAIATIMILALRWGRRR
jgi:hypothetical protein